MHIYDFALNKEIEEIYLNYALYSLAKSMIGIFVPIFLLSQKFSLGEIIIFYMIYFAIFGIFSFPSMSIVRKWGAKHAMALGMPFLIVFYLLLGSLPELHMPIWIIAFIGGFHEALYWLGFHTDFSIFSSRGNRGQQVGLLISIPLILTIAGPIAGGLCITLFGFPALFLVSSFLLLLSIFPLFMTPDIKKKPSKMDFSLFGRKHWRQAVGYIGFGMREMGIVLFWPIAVYLVVNSSIVLGLAVTLELLFAAIVTLGVGIVSDRISKIKLLQSSSVLDAVSWGFRLLAVYYYSLRQIFGIAAVGGITGAAQSVSFSAMVYNRTQRRTVDNLIFRESMMSLGRILILALVLLFFLDNLIYALAIVAIGSLLLGFFR